MKRTLLLLLIALMSINFAYPANNEKEEFMQFMGIPIDGSVSSFARKLQSKGFKLVTYVDDNVLLVGNFAGYSDCSVYVCGDNEKKMSHVFVSLPVQSSWSELEKRYSSLKTNLTEKYGNPVCIEECKNANSTDFMAQLSNGECNYRSEFTVVDKNSAENSRENLKELYNKLFPNGKLDSEKLKKYFQDSFEKSLGMPAKKFDKLPAEEKSELLFKAFSNMFRDMADVFDTASGKHIGNVVLTIMNTDQYGQGKITLLYQDEKQKQRIHKENIKDL